VYSVGVARWLLPSAPPLSFVDKRLIIVQNSSHCNITAVIYGYLRVARDEHLELFKQRGDLWLSDIELLNRETIAHVLLIRRSSQRRDTHALRKFIHDLCWGAVQRFGDRGDVGIGEETRRSRERPETPTRTIERNMPRMEPDVSLEYDPVLSAVGRNRATPIVVLVPAILHHITAFARLMQCLQNIYVINVAYADHLHFA